MNSVTLTSAEREKFALYLERDAADSEALISKLEQTPGGGILATLMICLNAFIVFGLWLLSLWAQSPLEEALR